jgi:prophage maintenance system killer protein
MGKKNNRLRLDIDRIIESLSDVQRSFPEINQRLRVRRENLTDEIVQNMVAGYKFVDQLVGERIMLFTPEYLHHILELNHIVLCGRGYSTRLEYGPHLKATRERFYVLIVPIMKWYKKHKDSSPVKIAAEVYIGVLSRPQLFIEGNHRTGALLASYILLMNGEYPFVLNEENALAYFEPSSQIKFTNKQTIKGKLRLPKYEKEFKKFLEQQISSHYVLKSD